MLGFIGTGNMASAIIKGAVSSEFLKGNEICVYDKDREKAEALSDIYGVYVCESEKEVCENAQQIILSVKPNVLEGVFSCVKETLKEKNPLIISIAAGKSLSFLKENAGYDARIIRVMPNINAVVLEAISAYCPNENADKDDMLFAEGLLSSFGKAVRIEEDKFSVFTAIGGCRPAFSYMYIDALARAGVKNGLPKSVALEVAAQAVFGSAKMIAESDAHPYELVDRVCSPGGTTIEGVASLQRDGFEAAVAAAVEAAINKDKRM